MEARVTATEQYLQYLEERARHLRREPWFATYPVWRFIGHRIVDSRVAGDD